MWPDNETERDFLNFSGVAATVAEIIVQADGRPISIGMSGAWGVGKSSMIKLVRAELNGFRRTRLGQVAGVVAEDLDIDETPGGRGGSSACCKPASDGPAKSCAASTKLRFEGLTIDAGERSPRTHLPKWKDRQPPRHARRRPV